MSDSNTPIVSDDEAVNLFWKMNNGDDSKDSKPEISDSGLDQGGGATPAGPEEQHSQDINGHGQAEDDPWAEVPEQLRNEYLTAKQRAEQYESQYHAVTGRLAPTQRELEAARKQLAEIEKQKGAKGDSDAVPTASDIAGKSMQQLHEEWPDVAVAMQTLLEAQRQEFEQRLTPLQQMEAERRQQQEQAAIQNELTRLSQAHPDYAQIASNPAFENWVATQPRSVQAMYGSTSADDNIVLLNLYKGATGAAQPAPKPRQSKPLSDHAEIPRKGAGRAAVDPESLDPVELFMRLNANKS
ncbi:hypothetical protein [Rheinheimera tilapiae]|uniref:Scaffolding protein n=1 Tax=Rheinheimera tilapiae TaxID=875043 RepID=A0ABV6BAA1_9GAMM